MAWTTFNDITDFLGFTNKGVSTAADEASDIVKQGAADYAKQAQAAAEQYKAALGNVNDYYKEGQSVAGQVAQNKAGEAKRQAKAAAAMANGSKMTQALAGAQAAANASTQGYDATATQAANMSAGNHQASAGTGYDSAMNAAKVGYDANSEWAQNVLSKALNKQSSHAGLLDRAVKTAGTVTAALMK